MDYKICDLISLSLAFSAQWMPYSNSTDSNPKAGYSDYYTTPVTRQTPFHYRQLIFFFQ